MKISNFKTLSGFLLVGAGVQALEGEVRIHSHIAATLPPPSFSASSFQGSGGVAWATGSRCKPGYGGGKTGQGLCHCIFYLYFVFVIVFVVVYILYLCIVPSSLSALIKLTLYLSSRLIIFYATKKS